MNEPYPVPHGTLDMLFEELRDNTELVVLDSCLSANQARIISKHIPYVMGTTLKIKDNIAIRFSEGLFNGLGEGNGILKSIKRGLMSVSFEVDNPKKIYQIWHEGNIHEW